LNFEVPLDEFAVENLAKLSRTVGEPIEIAENGPNTINMYFEYIERVMNTRPLCVSSPFHII
jgi:hypothetical protein